MTPDTADHSICSHPVSASSSSRDRSASALTGHLSSSPHVETFHGPHVSPLTYRGRFFVIHRIPSGLWRVELYAASVGRVSHRDFGSTDQDYILAHQHGQEWAYE